MRAIRALLAVWLCFGTQLAAQEPGTMCSQGRFGHAHCLRPSFFAFDLCQALHGEAARHGLDPGFLTRLIWQESRFDPNAISPANAMGIAQFIASTAKLRGLDDPFNPGQALEASAQYLAFLTQEFGNPGLAAVAYNSGESRAARFLAGQSGLPRETVNYVQIITGLSAQTWRDAPPAKPDFRLSATAAFLPACLDLAKTRRSSALRPIATVQPWGVQIGFGRTRKAARILVQRNTGPCRSLVSNEKIDFVKVRHRVQGRKGYIMARISRPTRASGDGLCKRLRESGCRCQVYAN